MTYCRDVFSLCILKELAAPAEESHQRSCSNVLGVGQSLHQLPQQHGEISSYWKEKYLIMLQLQGKGRGSLQISCKVIYSGSSSLS